MALKNLLKARSSLDESGELRATLGEHLEEIRKRIFAVAIFWVIASCLGWWPLQPIVYKALVNQVNAGLPKDFQLTEAILNITEPFFLTLRLSLWIGAILTIPFAVYHLWGFVKPGLKPNEIKPLRIVVPISVVLFVIGASLGWYVLPPTIGWFVSFAANYQGVQVIANVRDLVFLCAKLILAFGLSFQLPLVVYFLTRVGIVTPETLMRSWKHSVVGVFVFAAVLTPTGDPITMSVLAVPLCLLFFASVIAAKTSAKKSKAQERVDELNDLD
ncbi:MAG: twin-arginine translocase subunit TatC [Fimbriimonadaceae bacterium]|jgi:sec-independent protein translocase protein TatC|nr:twin-arginine translocase subunit TatC [Fimbriimonadaceae bacterium]